MAAFESARSFWSFRDHIRRRNRYVLDDSSRRFLDTVLATSGSRQETLEKGKYFWRAQRGHHWRTMDAEGGQYDVPGPHLAKRMQPLGDRAHEGRVNPKGIPCLYVSTNKETAMAETRPAVGSYVSVGQFKTLRELNVVDCSVGHDSSPKLYFEEPEDGEKENAVWNDIDRAFSTPVSNDLSSADYAATQYLSELFKSEGFDGVAYKSNLGTGFNIALFDLGAADLINCFLYQVKNVEYEFDETANPYFVSKYYESKHEDDESEPS